MLIRADADAHTVTGRLARCLSQAQAWREETVVKNWRRILVALALVLALSAWLGPYALSSYHLEAGGRALGAALEPVSLDWLAPEQIVDAKRLKAGAAHLHQAIRWDPRNVQAMRLLARVYVTQGRSEAALETSAGTGRAAG